MVSETAVEENRVLSANALRVFVSSRMVELAEERAVVRQALRDAGCEPWLYESDAGAAPGPPRETYLEELYRSDVYLGLFWKTRGAYTIDEFDTARRNQIACLIYERPSLEREPELSALLDVIGHVETGVTIRRFDAVEELGELVAADIARLQAELIRVIGTGGRSYTRSPHGGRFDQISARTPIRRHPLRVSNAPRPPSPFVDRSEPIRRLREGIENGESLLGVSGELGIGKSSVLRSVAHDPGVDMDRFPDGLGIHIEADGWPRIGDFLRALWSELYRVAERTFAPDDVELRADLRPIRVLVIADRLRLRSDEVDRLHGALPESTFVLAAEEPDSDASLSYAKTVQLRGFTDPSDIVSLFGSVARQQVPDDLADEIVDICRREGAGPGVITRLANDLWGSGASIAAWLETKRGSADPVATVLGSGASEEDRRLLGLLAAYGPDVATPREVIANLDVPSATVDRWVSSGDVIENSPELRLTGPSFAWIRRLVETEEYRGDVFDAAVRWVEEAPAARITEARAFILRLIDWGREEGRAEGVVVLARALAPQLAVVGAWESWGQVATQALEAGRMLGDPHAEAWALHEAGTRDLMLGNIRRGRRKLTRARRIRRRSGDTAGAAVSSHNLSHFRLLPTFGRMWALIVGVAAVIVIAAIAAQGGAVLEFGEVPDGETAARHWIFSNGDMQRAHFRLELAGDPAFCLVASPRTVCGSQIRPKAAGDAVAGGPDVEQCDLREEDPDQMTLTVAVPPQTECAVMLTFSPVLEPGQSRRAFRGELLIVGNDDEETVQLRGVGFRPAETSTTVVETTVPTSVTSSVTATTSVATTVEESTSTTRQPNRPPVANDDHADVTEGDTTQIDVLNNDLDPDSDVLMIEVLGLPEWGNVEVGSGDLITYVHDGSETTVDSFTYRVSDGELTSGEATVEVSITPLNDSPEARDDQAEVDEGGEVVIEVLENDTDPEGDDLTIGDTSPPDHGTLETLDDRTLLYSHDNSEFETDSFQYTIGDGQGGVAQATVAITIIPVNNPPTASSQDVTVGCDPAVLVLSGTDPDGDPLGFAIAAEPDFGSLSSLEAVPPDQARVTYTPGDSSADRFTFEVSDGASTDTADVTISVQCVE